MIVLDTLAPAERLAFVLHDIFGIPFDEIAAILNVPRPPPASSPAAPAGASGAQPRPSRPTWAASGGSPMPSSPRCEKVTSTRLSRCWTPMSCSGTTAPGYPGAQR
jgi:hypothetical protein